MIICVRFGLITHGLELWLLPDGEVFTREGKLVPKPTGYEHKKLTPRYVAFASPRHSKASAYQQENLFDARVALPPQHTYARLRFVLQIEGKHAGVHVLNKLTDPTLELDGHVEINTRELVLQADGAVFHEGTGEIEARGNVRFKPVQPQ